MKLLNLFWICQPLCAAFYAFLKNQVDNSLNFIFAFCISYQQGLKRSVMRSKRFRPKAMPLHRVHADLLTTSEIDFVNTLDVNKNK